MNYTQQSLTNHYYPYTTNCKSYVRRLYWKDTSPVILPPTNQNLYNTIGLLFKYNIQAYIKICYQDTAFNAINSWIKNVLEASIQITDHPSAYLKMAQN